MVISGGDGSLGAHMPTATNTETDKQNYRQRNRHLHTRIDLYERIYTDTQTCRHKGIEKIHRHIDTGGDKVQLNTHWQIYVGESLL